MESGAEKHGGTEESWIPDELASVTDISEKREREEADAASKEWVPDGLPERPVEKPKDKPKKKPLPDVDVDVEAEQEAAAPETEAEPDASAVVSKLRDTEEMLVLAEQRAREAEERGERLSDEIEHLERKLEKKLTKSATEAQARIAAAEAEALKEARVEARAKAEAEARAEIKRRAKAEPQPAPPPRKLKPPPVPRPPRGDKQDLNGITFEALRVLGLSVTQSARLIAQRDERGGFHNLSDLDTVWGMPHETLEQLKQSTYV